MNSHRNSAEAVVFEKMVARIHMLLEESSAEVTWNDKISDPDNPTNKRQIDATIRIDGKLTLVECRFQKKRQDVKWIEELIGRRTSLGADAVIAVSSSGFTKGGLLKAKKHGIITRDFLTLTEEEVQRWGKVSKVTLNYMKFDDAVLTLTHSSSLPQVRLRQQDLITLFYQAADKATKEVFDNLRSPNGRISVGFNSPGLTVSGLPVNYVKLEAQFDKITQTMSTAAVLAYGLDNEEQLARKVYVEEFSKIAKVEHVGDRNTVVLDLSKVAQPRNTVYHSTEFEMFVGEERTFNVVVIGDFRPSLELQFQVVLGREKR
jgi:hypothetical protein